MMQHLGKVSVGVRGMFALILSLLVIVSDTSPAQAAQPTISELTFEGLKRVEADAVKLILSTRKGQTFVPSKVTADIRAIYGMGYFSNVEVYRESTGADSIRLVYKLTEKPAIRRILIEGNDSISDDDIKEVIDIRPFTILSESKVKRNVQKIREHYVEKGYYLAEIDYRLDRTSKSEVTVVFAVNENAKVEVRRIQFVGNKSIDSDTLKSAMATREGDWLSFLTDGGTYRKEVFEIDLLRASSLYFDKGFINVKMG